MPKDYNDKTKLNAITDHHSIGLHYRGFIVCLDVQCGPNDDELVKRLVKYLRTTLNSEGKKSLDKLAKYKEDADVDC
jgi:hypothetical protein